MLADLAAGRLLGHHRRLESVEVEADLRSPCQVCAVAHHLGGKAQRRKVLDRERRQLEAGLDSTLASYFDPYARISQLNLGDPTTI